MAYPVTVEWLEDGDVVTIDSAHHLSELLSRIKKESDPSKPVLVMLNNDGGQLTIGVGAEVSTLNHIPPSGNPPYLICLGDADATGVIDYFCAGHHTQFLLRNTISNELAMSAALDYAETGRLSDFITWEGV